MMSDDAEEPESKAGEPTPPKTRAEDNPWYLLATLYGEPEFQDVGLQAKNRVAWNRYFAANLDDEMRARLIEEKRHPTEELTPFSPEELREVATTFAERCKTSAKNLALPASDTHINFSNVEFALHLDFRRYLFSGWANFNDATFSVRADFGGATFSRSADFGGATFSSEASFGGATFSGRANFDGATFSRVVLFDGAIRFADEAYFANATFSGRADFGSARFGGLTNFKGATFSHWAGFIGSIFSWHADFGSALFSCPAYFGDATFERGSELVNAEMKDTTSFKGATFKTKPPEFFGAKLHQGTVWRGIKSWPTPKKADEAGAFIDAYACLKLEMDRLKKHEDELDFFALEMQSRRVLLGPWRGLPIALYGFLSDYGRSYARPQYALFTVAAVGTLVLLLSGAVTPWQSLGLSIANTLNVFGFRKDFFDAATIENLPALLKILAALQTILGTILLFLFGLGVRNKFRMK